MRVGISLSLDTERDADIITRIKWLRENKPRQVSARLRDLVRLGMAREGGGELERKVDRVLELLESGAMVQGSAPVDEDAPRRVGALDKLGL